MNDPTPIPVPWPVRWRQWRHHTLPIVCFFASVLGVCWLWSHQLTTHQAVGEVMSVRVDVVSPCYGVVVELPRPTSGDWTELDLVNQGDTLALIRPVPLPGTAPTESTSPDSTPIAIPSPINGCVLEIQRHTGQNVQPSEPIMTITGHEAKYIIAYVPDSLAAEMVEGTSVNVAPRKTQGGYVPATVERVGLSLEQIPSHHIPLETVSRWGVPVRIQLPKGIPLRPGSLVDITL